MRQTLIRLSSRMSTLFPAIFRSADQQRDQQKLVRHIVAINTYNSTDKIMAEAARCLCDMVGYHMFCFVMKSEEKVEVWSDPAMAKGSLEQVICNDFNIKDKERITWLNQLFHPDKSVHTLDLKGMVFYDFEEENSRSMIYMLPLKNDISMGDEVVSLILESASTAIIRQVKIDNLTDAAVIDSLTGCYNRREFENQLKRHVAGATRHKSDLSVFMLDLDRFKSINDTYGHPAGDKVLQEVASLVLKNMRSGDVLARYGGEEFIAILPETDKYKAMELADRLRIKISQHAVTWGEETIRVTASFGVAEMDPRADLDRIVQDADTMLYKAKISGRNTIMPGLIKVVPSKMNQFR